MKAFAGMMAAAVLAVAGTASAQVVLYTTDFETDPSASFSVAISSADTEADFAYDYSTWVPTAPTAGITNIGTAPTAAGTKGLKLRANFDATGTDEAVGAFLTDATADLANKTVYTIKFDAFQLWNGPAGAGGTGTTTAMLFGIGVPGVAPTLGSQLNGFLIHVTGEGGAAQDYRYYEGTGAAALTRDDSVPNWNGANELDAAAAGWVAALPNPNGNGTPGRQWVTWTIDRNGSAITISVQPQGGSNVQVASFSPGAIPAAGVPFFGFTDPFTGSVADPASDNFVVIDNLTVTEPAPPPTSVTRWSVYE